MHTSPDPHEVAELACLIAAERAAAHGETWQKLLKFDDRVAFDVIGFPDPDEQAVLWLIDRRILQGYSEDVIDFEQTRRSLLKRDCPVPIWANENIVFTGLCCLCHALLRGLKDEERLRHFQQRLHFLKPQPLQLVPKTRPSPPVTSSPPPTPKMIRTLSRPRIIKLM